MRSEIPRVVDMTFVMGAVRCDSVAIEDNLASRCPNDQVTFPKAIDRFLPKPFDVSDLLTTISHSPPP